MRALERVREQVDPRAHDSKRTIRQHELVSVASLTLVLTNQVYITYLV